MTDAFRTLVDEQYNIYDNINIFLNRTKPYNENGREQTFEEAKVLDVKMKCILEDRDIDYIEMDATRENMVNIAKYVENYIRKVSCIKCNDRMEIYVDGMCANCFYGIKEWK